MQKILIIEDDNQIQIIYKKALSIEGFTVITAKIGNEGLELAKSQNPDLILLDLMLAEGGLNGFDVLHQLKIDQNLAKIPVIILTNLDSEKDSSLASGAVDYIIKANTSIDEVVNKIKEHLPA